MSDEQLFATFRDQAVRGLPADQVERVLQQCWRIDRLPRVGDLVAGAVPV